METVTSAQRVRAWAERGLRIAGAEDEPRTMEELRARVEEIESDIAALDHQFRGAQFDQEATERWNALNTERDELRKTIAQNEARQAQLERIAAEAASASDIVPGVERGADVHTRAPGATTGQGVYDLTTLRAVSPERMGRELRDRVMRSVDESHFPHPSITNAKAREHVAGLLERFGADEDGEALGVFARRVLQTGSDLYKRAFGKHIAGAPMTSEEQRALALGGSGAYAVPYTLDPTIVPTSNSSVNPWRAVSQVIPITTNNWKGVTSGAVTAAYAAEGTEATDDAPTLAQPSIDAERAQAFIPFSMEIGQDWGQLQAEMAVLIQDGKDDLEAVKFYSGGGTDEPFGIKTGLTTTVRVQTAATAAFTADDLYALEAQVPPRFRSRSDMVMSRAIISKVRQFDEYGGANLVMRLPEGVPTNRVGGQTNLELLGYPLYESSAIGAVLTSATVIAILGDFRHFVIVERIGMSIEVIPHLFGSARRFPTGQRGLYAFWRNGSKVIAENAFRYLETL